MLKIFSEEVACLLYIGRNNNVHDQRFVKELSKYFQVVEIYTKNLESKTIPMDLFAPMSVIVAGPLTDAITVIPESIKVPIFGVSHAFDLNTEFDDPAIRGNIARCEAILSDCAYITNILRSTYDFRKQIYEIPWGCDRDYFSEVKVQFEDKLKILVTRNWFPMYRNDVVVKALNLLGIRKLDFHCTFIGDGPLLDIQVENQKKLGKSLDIRFLGHQSGAEIRNAMSDSWIYISAASSDGTSISLLEAMAAGMICVTTDFPSNCEWIEHSVNGFVFPNGDSVALAALIEQISSLSLEEKEAISRKAKELILKRGDWKLNREVFTSAVIDLVDTGIRPV